MRRKLFVLGGIVASVALVIGLLGWTTGRSPNVDHVDYSPLFQQRVVEALVPVTSQAVLAGNMQPDTRADCQPTWDCQETFDCNETWDCQETFDCDETWDCDKTSDCETVQCPPTHGDERTCAGTNYHTCSGETCDSDACEDDGPTIAGAAIAMCTTFEGPGCEGATFYVMARSCEWLCLPTYVEKCPRPTSAGPTCRGPTCFHAGCEVRDFGDAPDGPDFAANLRTLLENDGARHVIDGTYYLGLREDAEVDGKPHPSAAGDDDPPWDPRDDDEDGVWFATTLVPGQAAVVVVRASAESKLHGWIDYDRSGTWLGESDRLFEEPFPLQPGFNWVWFTVPEDAVAGNAAYARFRLVGPMAEPPLDHGKALEGEVEDYRISICQDYQAWLLTDEILYDPGQSIAVSFNVSEVSQVTLIRHRSDGESRVVLSATVEPGRHEFPAYGETFRADEPFGAETLELVVTGLQSGCTAWLTTPYVTAGE